MISGAFRILFFAILSLVAGWGGIALSGSTGTRLLTQEGHRFRAAFPFERFRLSPAVPGAGADGGLVFPDVGDATLMRDSFAIIRGRVRVAADFVPVFFFVLAAGGLLGSILRERIRFGLAYASPLLSFVSKRTAELSLVYFFFWSFTPIGLPFWSLYATLPPVCFGTLGYFSNLPTRL